MPLIDAIWDLPNDPAGNVRHIGMHGLTQLDVEHVLSNSTWRVKSHSSGRPAVFGITPDGIRIIVVYEEIDDQTVYPVTAYPVESELE